jgi:glycosyltransferase involved in cell wall biosynthesis
MRVSVILPVYNERENLGPLLQEITEALAGVSHEIIAVDDASTDGSAETLAALAVERPTLKLLRLQAHAGQSAACAAGFGAARGDIIVTMDADGQNDPTDVTALLNALADDPTLAAAVGYRVVRRDSRWKLVQSRIANAVRNWITGDSIRDTGCSLKAIRTDVVYRLPRFNGMHRFIPTLVRQGGGRVVEIPVSHRPRRWGESKYGIWNRVFRGLRDALGVRWLSRRALAYAVVEETAEGEE